MNANRLSIFWGAVLIVAGALFLAREFGFDYEFTPYAAMVLLAGLCIAFLATYWANGPQEWGWLFPAAGTGAGALAILLVEGGLDGQFVGSLVMWIVAAPFAVIFLANPREHWWALIPGWVLVGIGAALLAADRLAGDLFAVLVLGIVALPFLVAYLWNREQWWALVPAGVLAAVMVVILAGTRGAPQLAGSLFFWIGSAAFLVVYARNTREFWPLIPAGVLATLGVVVWASMAPSPLPEPGFWIAGLLFGGLATTFSLLWLLQDRYDSHWAKYPALVLGIMALLALAGESTFTVGWPVALVLAGLWLIFKNRRTGPGTA